MHLSTNISHWVCLVSGLFLIGTGLVSHLHPEPVSSGATVTSRADAHGVLIRRLVMIAIGFLAVVYALSRLLP